jgi:hypothetical protein
MMSSWKEYKLGEVISSNNQSIDKNYKFENIQYLDTGSITNNKIDGFQVFKISEAPSRAKRLVKHQDIVYSTVRPIQRHFGFIENPNENLVVSTYANEVPTNHINKPSNSVNHSLQDNTNYSVDKSPLSSFASNNPIKSDDNKFNETNKNINHNIHCHINDNFVYEENTHQ